MIRLRQSIERGLRHPLAGPFLLLLIGLVLAFVVFHAIEHGVEGQLFTCAMLAAAALRLVIVVGQVRRVRTEVRLLSDRAPPGVRPRRLLEAIRPPTFLFALPLRR